MQKSTPPFRADHVGSLLRPATLKQAREKRAKGEIEPAALKAVEDREIERVIEKQEEVGLQSVTDGEFRRSWWHLDFLWGLDGIEKHVMDSGIAFAGVNTRNEGLKVTGKIGFSGHPMIEHFKFVDLDQLCLSPQCGFASTEEGNILAEEEQWAKLRMIVAIAKDVWG